MHPKHIYRVGDKVHHAEFGDGLVVEIRDRPFFDVLEIVFSDGVKRLTSIHPLLKPKPRIPTAIPRRVRHRKRRSPSPSGGNGDAGKGELSAVVTLEGNPQPLLKRILRGKMETFEDYCLHLEAEERAAKAGFQRLTCLDHIQDVERLEYQHQACLRVMREMRGRALLADEVGLGKTIEAGMILKEYMLRGLVHRALVLVPASLTIQWRDELASKFGLDFSVAGRRGNWDENPLLICSLDTAKTARNRSRLQRQGFDIVIVDEAHRLRNHQTLAWRFVSSLKSNYLLLLTATPVQNDLRELYNLVNLLRPGTLGTYRGFRRRFMVRGDKRLPKNTAVLSSLLRQIMIRTTRAKTNIRFPRRTVHILPFTLSREEQVLYREVTEFVRNRYHDSDRTRFLKWHFVSLVLQKEIGSSTPAALHTLRRAQHDIRYRSHWRELKRLYELGTRVTQHAKLGGLLRILRETQGKAIVFTQFKSTMEFLAERLHQEGLDTVVFHGGLASREKESAIEAFRDRVRILLSTEAGGEGRNLHFCRTVINYDLPWNPMKVEQRIGRVHRLGQTGDIQIYNFSAENTVEAHVLEILHRKINMFELVIGEMDMILGDFNEKQSFEARVFQIWAEARNRRDLERGFQQLGDQVALSRRRYESVRSLDEEIFGG